MTHVALLRAINVGGNAAPLLDVYRKAHPRAKRGV